MNLDPNGIKKWLADDAAKDRQWLADEIGVSKRTLDNWFSSEFPLYAQKAIERIQKELETPSAPSDDSFRLTPKEWRELSRRAAECGYEDEMEYLVAVVREQLSKKAE